MSAGTGAVHIDGTQRSDQPTRAIPTPSTIARLTEDPSSPGSSNVLSLTDSELSPSANMQLLRGAAAQVQPSLMQARGCRQGGSGKQTKRAGKRVQAERHARGTSTNRAQNPTPTQKQSELIPTQRGATQGGRANNTLLTEVFSQK